MTKYNNYNIYTDTVTASTGEVGNVMVYLPTDYKTKKYDVVFFCNGAGEDTGGVAKMAVWGPLAEIGANYQPAFIAVAIQSFMWFSVAGQQSMYSKLKALYNFDKMILTGISEGGWGSINILSRYPDVISQDVVAYIPMSSQANAATYTPVIPTIIKMGIPVWGFGDPVNDIHGIDTQNFIIALLKSNPKGIYPFTNTTPAGHGGWNAYYAPTYTLGGLNIYQWGLSFAGVTASTSTSSTTTLAKTTKPLTTSSTTTSTSTISQPILIATIQVFSDGTIKKT